MLVVVRSAKRSARHETKCSIPAGATSKGMKITAIHVAVLFVWAKQKMVLGTHSALLCKSCNVFPPRIGCFEIAWLKVGNRRYGYSHNCFAFFNLMANKSALQLQSTLFLLFERNFAFFPTTGLGFCPVFCVIDTVRANAWH